MNHYAPVFRSPISSASLPANVQFHLSDLSGVQVTLIQGNVADLLQAHFSQVPDRPGLMVDVDGGFLARLTATQFYWFGTKQNPTLTLPSLGRELIRDSMSSFVRPSTTPLPNLGRGGGWGEFSLAATLEASFRQARRFAHATDYSGGIAVLRAVGRAMPDVLSKLCGLDFHSDHFPNLHVAQTSVAKIKALIARHDESDTPGYSLHVDAPSGQYFWEAVSDAGQEFLSL